MMDSQGATIRLSEYAPGFYRLSFNSQGSVNKFDASTLKQLAGMIEVLATTSGVKGLLVTSELDSFIVGADIFEFVPLFAQPAANILAFIHEQSECFLKFARLPFPTLALINGIALGGGFEMALACDERIAVTNARVGLPETTLGIIPGFGGCVRLSRLIDPIRAMDWIISARPRSAQEALDDGAVQAIVDAPQLLTQGMERLAQLQASGEWLNHRAKREHLAPIPAEPLQALKAALQTRTRLEPAPWRAVEVIAQSVGLSQADACALESRAFAEVAKTEAAHALVGVFVNDQLVRKKAKSLAQGAVPVERIGVIGAGIMGTGIAEAAASVGITVQILDASQSRLAQSQQTLKSNLARQVAQGRLAEPQAAACLARVKPIGQVSEFADVAWVIEAVSEQLAIKQAVFSELSATAPPTLALASNTSSLSISTLSQMVPKPERFVGIHFFNPVPKMPLVEIIAGQHTAPAVTAQAVALALQLKKVPIVVGECAGFLVNRILMAYVAGFEAALAAGVSVAAIDAAMVAFGWPMGPAMLMDVIGLDTMVAIAAVIGAGIRPCLYLKTDSVIARLVALGHLGQKTGQGFYRHERDDKGRWVSHPGEVVTQLLPGNAGEEPLERTQDRLMVPMCYEAKRCLDEGIGASAAEIDMALLLGLGFPKAKGGPLCLAEWRGWSELHNAARAIAPTDGLYTLD
jgi:3-hydroxyacyl-CoA dehydrogenase / enoyl-CoA hydratase / 3-hydroxybutyryl-CoA epimerase / enoyl-CoA isomerase